jgi:hypothetical protein
LRFEDAEEFFLGPVFLALAEHDEMLFAFHHLIEGLSLVGADHFDEDGVVERDRDEALGKQFLHTIL